MGERSALLGLVVYLLVAVAPPAVLWASLRVLPAAVTSLAERRARRSAPLGPTLESLVSDLRRLRGEVRGPPQRTQVRRIALVAAYDDALLDVCRVVGLTDPPLASAVGAERAFARLQTEATLEAAGIALDPPCGRGSTAA